MGNNKKTTQPKITMKFFTAALLAIGAAAIKLKEGGTQGPPEGGEGGHGGEGESEFPFPPPDCPEKPDTEGWKPIDYFNAADTNQSGGVDAQEGFNALYCAVVWEEMSREDAEWLYHFLTDHAQMDPEGNPEELDKSEAKIAFNPLEEMHAENEERHEHGEEDLPYPPPDC